MAKNQAVVFREYVPSGLPEMGKHFTLEDVDEPGPLSDGDVLTRLRFVSVDPYLRGRMKDRESYFPCFTVDQPGTLPFLTFVSFIFRNFIGVFFRRQLRCDGSA
jgi:NADPH-dependent curcumin reductase CurA